MRRDAAPATPAKVIDVEATPVTEAKPPKLLCKVSGKVEHGRKVSLRVDQSPGALLAVFGDRQDGAETPGDYQIPPAFSAQSIEHLASLFVRDVPEDFEGEYKCPGLNAVLQAMSAFEPTNELEGMIAVQATALHFVTMDSLARAQRQSDVHVRATNIGHANKCSRTFAALVETLNRHRGKTTTQRVIVENVNVAAGGQAVVGAVAGVGSKQNGVIQTHANAETSHGRADDRAPIAALPSPDPEWETVPASGSEEPEAMPNARRRGRNRCAEGQPEQLEARPLQRSGDGSTPHDPRAAPQRGQPRMNGDRL
jgi:hypothetical protein